MQDKLLLVDGYSILHRAFYGIPLLTNAEGLHTNAVYGFLNILFKILEEESPKYLTVAFDVHAPTFRHEMYDAYKGTRSAMPDELREQIPVMREVLNAMGIRVEEQAGFEADDIIGTLAVRGEKEGLGVVILSGDRDLLQLATDSVMVRIPKTSKGKTEVFNYFAKDVETEYGVTPSEFIDLKALMGDSSDNIPGLPGVGIKTATAIISKYHSIEEAKEHTEEIRPKKAMEAMRDQFELAVLSKKLATIRTDVPLSFEMESAKLGDIFNQEAYALFKKLGFRNHLTRFENTEKKETEIAIQTPGDQAEIDALIKEAKLAKELGLSILADAEEVRGIGLALGRDAVFYLDAAKLGVNALKEIVQTLLAREGETAVFDLKQILLAVPSAESGSVTDIRIAAYLLDPLRADYPYDALAAEYAGLSLPSAEEIFGARRVPEIAKMEEAACAKYTAYQALAALACREALLSRLDETGMRDLFLEIEMPLVYTLADMERAGMRVDAEALSSYGAVLGERIALLEQQIYEAAGEVFNINSPKQLGVILFEKMGLPGGKKTKTGYSTAADVLEKLAPDVPFVSDILSYRQLSKLKSTYADALHGFIRADGRIHSNFNQTVTATGRISSNEPNLQNIPIRMELGREIRKVFVAEEGNVLIDADYSQIELRVLAAMSGDEQLIEAYREAKDIHRITASQVFHVPFEEVTDLQRRNAKAVNFGIVYGISAFGLSQDLDVSREEASAYIRHYFETYPAIKAFLDGLVASAKEKGYALTLYGRRRPVPELASANFMQRSFGERIAMNSPIQGTAADIIKMAMNRVHKRLLREGLNARLILQVHDELLIEAPKEEEAAVKKLLEEEMTGAADLAVALVVDMHSGQSWYEAK